MHYLLLLCYIVNLQDWDDYGIDWDGPVPLSSDDDTVMVEEIEDILSKAIQLSLISPNLSMNESLLVNQFATVKAFIINTIEN